jgi:hypothetical protein
MKSLYVIVLTILFYCCSMAQSRGTITDINSHTVNLDSMCGKKMLIMLLPLQRDTAVISQLLRFQNNYVSSVVVGG